MNKTEIGLALKNARLKKNMTHRKLTDSGINVGSSHRIEQAKNYTIDNLIQYCEVLGFEIVLIKK